MDNIEKLMIPLMRNIIKDKKYEILTNNVL